MQHRIPTPPGVQDYLDRSHRRGETFPTETGTITYQYPLPAPLAPAPLASAVQALEERLTYLEQQLQKYDLFVPRDSKVSGDVSCTGHYEPSRPHSW